MYQPAKDKLYLGGEEFFLDAIRHDFPVEELIAKVGHHRQALHAWKATFRHPRDREPMTLTAPLSDDLVALAEQHGIDARAVAG